MKLSIIIPSYNMASKIDQCLESSLGSDADRSQYEIVVCDSSDDGSMEVYKKWCMQHGNLKVVHSHARVTCGTARNIAAKQCVGDYILCMDIDDKLATKDSLQKVLDGLDGKDIYACSYVSRRDKVVVKLNPKSIGELARVPVACWDKIYKRELYVNFPSYMPEDVVAHYKVIDRCKTLGFFEFPVVDYDNTPENKGAISRTFDWLISHQCNLMQLSDSGQLKKLGLREEYLHGVIHNLADMLACKDKIVQPEVKKALVAKLRKEYSNFMAGIYVH